MTIPETPTANKPTLAELNATLAELRAQLAIVRGSLEQFEAAKLAAFRKAHAVFSAAINAANAQHAADVAPLVAIEAELVAEVETTEADALQAELREGR